MEVDDEEGELGHEVQEHPVDDVDETDDEDEADHRDEEAANLGDAGQPVPDTEAQAAGELMSQDNN